MGLKPLLMKSSIQVLGQSRIWWYNLSPLKWEAESRKADVLYWKLVEVLGLNCLI